MTTPATTPPADDHAAPLGPEGRGTYDQYDPTLAGILQMVRALAAAPTETLRLANVRMATTGVRYIPAQQRLEPADPAELDRHMRLFDLIDQLRDGYRLLVEESRTAAAAPLGIGGPAGGR